MNFIIEKYLSNFVEIDTSQTKASIFSGIINLKNLKIKSEIFETINLPYFEVVNGYIGSMTIKLKMPRFYKYPINVEIEKVLIHIRQKNIDNKLKSETIKAMEDYKYKMLLNEEELRLKWDKVDNEESNIFSQIINDLQIEIKEVVFHYDDSISCKEVPFTLGIILNKIIIRSANKDFIVEENMKENIPYQEINYKVFKIDKFSIFLDCFDENLKFSSQNLIKASNMRFPAKKSFVKNDRRLNDYYEYCMKELNYYSLNKNSHQYILYKMDLNVNISMNENYLKNKLPQYTVSIDLPKFSIRFNLKQLKTIFKVMAYYNLNQLYQNGIATEFYEKKISEEEKNQYIENYIKYYQEKYFVKNELKMPKELSDIENALSFEVIQEMRKIAYKKLDNINEYIKKKKELENEESKWYGKDLNKIEELKKELENLEKKRKAAENNSQDKNISENSQENIKGKYEELSEIFSYKNSSMIFNINEIRFIIYENAKRNDKEKLWEYKDILIKFVFTSFDIEGKIFHNGLILTMSLENAIITQEKTKNPNFHKLFFGDLDINGKMLYMEFEINPNFEKSDYRFIMKSEKRIHIVYDIHIFNYIMEKIMSILNTKINFTEIKNYAQQKSVNQYIELGYVNLSLENFQHFNIDLIIDLAYPIILLPLDPFDKDNNKCLFLRLGKLQLSSNLPPRQEKGKEYIEERDEKLMYDEYIINLVGTKLSTITDCIPINNHEDYKGYETKIIRDFDLSVVCKKLIKTKNPHLDNLVCELNITKVEIELDEFQILFIIDYLGNFLREDKYLFEESDIDKFLGIGEEFKDEEELIKEYQRKISTNRKIIEESDSEFLGDSLQTQNLNESLSEEEKKTDNNNNEEEEKFENMNDNNKIIDAKENEDKNCEDKKSENNEKKDSYIRINEIKNEKKIMRIQFKMNEMSLIIKKIHLDLKRENFLVLVQKDFKIEYYLMKNDDMLTILRMNNIYLYDKDIDEKKFNIIEEQFQCLINSSQNISNNTISFIDMTTLYRKIGKSTEIDTIFNMNHLNIIISFDSLLRIYQFMMYYYDKYNEKVYEVTHPQEKFNNDPHLSRLKMSSKKLLNHSSIKKLSAKLELNLKKSKLIRSERANRFSRDFRRKSQLSVAKIKEEIIDSKITIVYNMKNTIFKVPLNPKDANTPIVSFSFNLIFNQKMTNLYTNKLLLPNNIIIETIYQVQDSNINLLISKVYLDIEFKNEEPSDFIFENEKLISNFRMSYFLSSFLSIPQKQSITISNIYLEPLFCKFGVKQMRIMFEFYKKVDSFWFDYNNVKYIPYVKPEYIINGELFIKAKQKRTFRKFVIRIMIAIDLRKGIKSRLKIIRKKKKNKKVIVENINNISDFNSHYEMNINFSKIIITFFDNISVEKRLLININIFHFIIKTISNTIIKDKNNLSNIIYEMITGEDKSLKEYNTNAFAYFMDIKFGLEINYFNLILNEFEPLIEKIKINYISMQTCPFSRLKKSLVINDIINFNISSNAIKVLNLFFLRYYQKDTKIKPLKKIKNPRKSSGFIFENKNIESNKEISLLLINYTELNIVIFFESNFKDKYYLKSGESLTFYKNDIFFNRNQNNHSSTLTAKINGKATIKAINFAKNNTRQYKLRLDYKNKEYDIYVSVKVNTSGLIKQVHFCPSISLYNDTNYKQIEIFIKNHKIKKNSLLISQNEKCYVPLTWSLCEPPLSNIFMRIKNNIEPIKIYEHINEAIIPPLNEEEKNQTKKEKNIIEKEAKNNKNKYWNQNVIKSFISECDNRKDNKIIFFVDENNSIYFSIDYYFVQSKDIPAIIEENEKKMNNQNLEDTVTTQDEYFNDYSYEYLLYIRPYSTFYNQLPFNLKYTHGNSNEKEIKTLNKSSLYCYLIDDDEQVRITFYYNGQKYRSSYFNITNSINHTIELLNCDNPIEPNLSCCVLKSSKLIEYNKNFNYDVKLIEFSTSSFEYIFYFKYFIMNKMPNSLWIKPFHKKKKKIETKETELKSGQLTVTSYNSSSNSSHKYVLRDENSKWSKPFDLKIIKENGTIEIDTENEKDDRKIINTKDISCILTWGKNFENSRIIILQQQFLIHNKLDFDIYYRQDKDKEKTNHFLKKGTFESINHITKEKKIFRIGLFDINCGEFNYSSPFDIGILKTVDLLIRINETEKEKYDSHSIYTNDNKNYFVLIRIESHIFDDGFIYLSLIKPYFPSLKIENETKTFVKIMESKNDPKPLIINNNISGGFPFVWKNNSEEKALLICEIYGIQNNFSFSRYGKESFEIEIEDESKESKSRETKSNISNDSSVRRISKHITFTVYAKNRSLTRCFKIEEREKKTDSKKEDSNLFLVTKDNKVTTSSFNIEIKGIGFSIINEALKELFYISFYSIKLKYLSNLLILENHTISENTENFELRLSNFQIDYCLNDSIKYIIAPKKQILPSNEEKHNITEVIFLNEHSNDKQNNSNNRNRVPFISLLVTRQFTKYFKTMEESTIYSQIDLIIQEFIIKIDQYTLTNLLKIINEFMILLDYSKKLEKESDKEDLKLLNEKTSERIKNEIQKKGGPKVLINYLFLSSMKIHLTIRLNLSDLYTSGFIKIITRFLGSIGNSLTRFTDVPLIFTEKGFENIYISITDMLWLIYEEYKRRGTKQILTILGSSDLIGNPVKLLEGIGTGFYELVNEPRKGFIQGPSEFGKGIAKGLGKLLSGIIGGTFGVVESITGTLYSATQSIMGKSHKNYEDEEEGPSNIASGAAHGIYEGFKQLADGLKGVVMHPIKGAKKNGAKGFFKGLGKGFIGLIVSPIAALLKILHSVSIGTKNTFNYIFGNSKAKFKRFRYPRVLLLGIESYDKEKAEAKEILYKNKIQARNIFYANYFYCSNKPFDKGLSMFVKTDTNVLIIFRSKKIIFKELIKNIKKCEIHYIKGEFIIKFCRKKGVGRGFKVTKEYYALACKIYDLFLSIKKEKEKESNQIIKTTELNNSLEENNNDTFLDVYEDEKSENNGKEEEEEEISEIIKKDKKKFKEREEIINIYNINNINNVYNINNINNIQNIYNNNNNNNISNENNNHIKSKNEEANKTLTEMTLSNNNSVFYSEEFSQPNNKKYSDKKNREKNKSPNNSSIGFNSFDNLIPKEMLKFSHSSSIQ